VKALSKDSSADKERLIMCCAHGLLAVHSLRIAKDSDAKNRCPFPRVDIASGLKGVLSHVAVASMTVVALRLNDSESLSVILFFNCFSSSSLLSILVSAVTGVLFRRLDAHFGGQGLAQELH
jgi:hypothetical protein